MFLQRSLQIIAVLLMVAISGEVVFAKRDYIPNDSDRDVEAAQEAKFERMSRMELQTALMRFAQMFIRGFAQKVYSLESQDASNKTRFQISSGELRTINILLDIATGPDAVDNLLDMVVFVTLARVTVEKRWDTKVLGKNKGDIPEFLRQMEKDIWTIAAKVLNPSQQKELRDLIRRWLAQHPNEHYIEGISFDRLSGMMGKSHFKDAGKPGFLLPEMNEATRSIDEARNLGERISFIMKHLPYILRTTTETGVYGFLNEPETIQLLSDIKRLTTAIEGIGLEVKQFPDRLSKEREKLLDDLLKSEGKLRTLSGQIQKSLAMGDQMATSVTEASASITHTAIAIDNMLKRIQSLIEPESLDIIKWFETVHEVTEAAKQSQVLVGMADKFFTKVTTDNRLTQIEKGFDALLLRTFIWAALLIVFFFSVLFGYRFLSKSLLRVRAVSL